MPIYEYYCDVCNTTVDVLHKMKDKPDVWCDNVECFNISRLERVISYPNLRFKGDGFYINDSKRAKGNKK
jgi:putative FmdB family regulatory protein